MHGGKTTRLFSKCRYGFHSSAYFPAGITVLIGREDLVSHLGTQFPADFAYAIGDISFSTCIQVPSSESLRIFSIAFVIVRKHISICIQQITGLQSCTQMKLQFVLSGYFHLNTNRHGKLIIPVLVVLGIFI